MNDSGKGEAKRLATIEHVEAWVQETLEAGGRRAHGWLHTARVRHHIRPLAQAEGVDSTLAELAALIHDVGRTQPGPENEHGARSAAMAAPILAGLPLTDDEREAVLHAVRWHNSKRDDTQLLRVLRDADMLDGLGAIGIMRAFVSQSHLPSYDPDTPFDQESARWPPICTADQVLGQFRFYDWLNTDTAREMAEERLAFMKTFVAQIRHEIMTDDQYPLSKP